MKRLVFLSPVPWESFSQRPHKFIDWIHSRTGASVLWVDPYPTRFPRLSDFRRLQKLPEPSQSSAPPSWLTVVKPFGLPIEPVPGSSRVNRWFWQQALAKIDDFVSHAPTWLVIGKPSAFALHLLKRLRHCRSMYDAMDNFPAFYAGFSRLALARHERLIAQRVDVIWASSSGLSSRWGRIRDDVRLVHNALDLSILNATRPARGSSTAKVLGYVGTIADWFDWEWVIALARARPNDEVRLIGPVFSPPANKLPANVALLPACSHEAALQAMTEFDVGLIPFKRNALTASVDPIKYYEYRALSLPVVSTAFGGMQGRSGMAGVFISQSTADIAPMITDALQCKRDPGAALEFALQNSWEVRFDAAKFFQ